MHKWFDQALCKPKQNFEGTKRQRKDNNLDTRVLADDWQIRRLPKVEESARTITTWWVKNGRGMGDNDSVKDVRVIRLCRASSVHGRCRKWQESGDSCWRPTEQRVHGYFEKYCAEVRLLDYKLDRNLPAVLITGVDAEKTPTFDVDFIKLPKIGRSEVPADLLGILGQGHPSQWRLAGRAHQEASKFGRGRGDSKHEEVEDRRTLLRRSILRSLIPRLQPLPLPPCKRAPAAWVDGIRMPSGCMRCTWTCAALACKSSSPLFQAHLQKPGTDSRRLPAMRP